MQSLCSSNRIASNDAGRNPDGTGLCLMRDAEDRLLYVGKSKNLRSRVRNYFRSQHDLSRAFV